MRFSLTPPDIFLELLRGVVGWSEDQEARDERRRRRLQKLPLVPPPEHGPDEDPPSAPWTPAPPHDPQPDGFRLPRQRAPRNKDIARQHSQEVLLDQSLTLLDLHFEENLRLLAAAAAEQDPEAAAEKGPKPHRSRIFRSVSENLVHERFQSFQLPAAVKALLRSRRDMHSWTNAEKLRDIIRDLIDAREDLPLLTASDLEQLANALAAGGGSGILGRRATVAGRKLEKGTQVTLPQAIREARAARPPGKRKRSAAPTAAQAAAAVRSLQPGPDVIVEVRCRPRGSGAVMILPEYKELFWGPQPLKAAAKDWHSRHSENQDLLLPEIFDGLLTQLGMVLWREQVRRRPARPPCPRTTDARAEGEAAGAAPQTCPAR